MPVWMDYFLVKARANGSGSNLSFARQQRPPSVRSLTGLLRRSPSRPGSRQPIWVYDGQPASARPPVPATARAPVLRFTPAARDQSGSRRSATDRAAPQTESVDL